MFQRGHLYLTHCLSKRGVSWHITESIMKRIGNDMPPDVFYVIIENPVGKREYVKTTSLNPISTILYDYEKNHIPLSRSKLTYNGFTLRTNRHLKSYGITCGETLHYFRK